MNAITSPGGELIKIFAVTAEGWLGGVGPIFRQENSDSNFMQMAAARCCCRGTATPPRRLRWRWRRGLHEGTARWYTKGCVTKVGRGWPPEPATRNSALRVGREGGKKSDKTMERNLNYAPRKMAIACKAMLIRRRRKTGGRRLRRRRQTPRRRFFLIAGTYFFFSFPPSHLDPRGSCPLLRPFSRTLSAAISTCRSTFAGYVPYSSGFICALYYCTFLAYGRRNFE